MGCWDDMSYWDDEEEHCEPGEFDRKIEELKEELRNSVRQEIKDEVKNLCKENKELQGIKKNFESVKRDFERKKAECDRMMQNAELNAKRARLTVLMELYKVTLWSAGLDYRYKKKCDKCDSWRNIQVTLPSGNVVNDACKCNVRKGVYHPHENVLYELSDTNREIRAFYKKRGETGSEYFVADVNAEYAKIIVDHDTDFKKLEKANIRQVFFTTQKECQAFCNYLNATEKISGYDYDLEGNWLG